MTPILFQCYLLSPRLPIIPSSAHVLVKFSCVLVKQNYSIRDRVIIWRRLCGSTRTHKQAAAEAETCRRRGLKQKVAAVQGAGSELETV